VKRPPDRKFVLAATIVVVAASVLALSRPAAVIAGGHDPSAGQVFNKVLGRS
jgi:hypothetical protein